MPSADNPSKANRVPAAIQADRLFVASMQFRILGDVTDICGEREAAQLETAFCTLTDQKSIAACFLGKILGGAAWFLDDPFDRGAARPRH
jgi:hypothetical protein